VPAASRGAGKTAGIIHFGVSMSYGVFITIFLLAGLFAAAFLLSIGFTYLARRVAVRLKIFDQPDKRKIHKRPVPYLGGVGMFLAFAVYGLGRCLLFPESCPAWLPVGLLCSVILVAAGVYDDIKGLSAWIKFPIQIFAALIFCLFTDVSIPAIGHPFGRIIEFGPLTVPVTILWTVLLINAINLIDGLDGLAAGVVCISSFFLFLMQVVNGEPSSGLLALGLSGVCFGFLRYNFPPARIFMGDAGSMFLGFILAVLSMTQTMKGTAVVTLLFPLLVLGIPILDTAMAFLRRLSQGKHPFQGDARHIHHRFLAIGLTDKQTVLVIYFFSLAFGMFALVISRLTQSYRLLTLGLLALLISFVLLAMRYLEEQLAAALQAVNAYKEWIGYHGNNAAGAGGAAREVPVPLPGRAEPAPALEDKKKYDPPALTFNLLDKLTRAEEQRTERVLVLASEYWREVMGSLLKNLGHEPVLADSMESVSEAIVRGELGAVIVEESKYGKEISDVVVRTKILSPEVTILVLADSAESPAALGLLRLGAYTILPSCASPEALEVMVHNTLESRYLSRRLKLLKILFWILIFSIPIWVVIGRFIALGALY